MFSVWCGVVVATFLLLLHSFFSPSIHEHPQQQYQTDCSGNVFGKKHTVDKIQMKSSSRSNTYVQNVKFRLYRSRFGVFFSSSRGGKSHVRLLSNSISKHTSKSTLTRSHAHTQQSIFLQRQIGHEKKNYVAAAVGK